MVDVASPTAGMMLPGCALNPECECAGQQADIDGNEHQTHVVVVAVPYHVYLVKI